MNKRLFFIAITLATLITITGCIHGGTTVNVQNETRKSLDQLEQLQYRSTITMNPSSDSGNTGQSKGLSFEEKKTGRVDLENNRLHIKTEINSSNDSIRTETYFIDGDFYTLPDGRSNQWIKSSFGDDIGNVRSTNTYISDQRKILDTLSNTEATESTLNGENVYKLSKEVEPAKLDGYIKGQIGTRSGRGIYRSINVSSIEVTQWISRQSFYPLKTFISAELNLSTQFIGNTENIDATTNINITYSRHNEDLGIELPEGAQNAISIEEFQRQRGMNDTQNESSDGGIIEEDNGANDGPGNDGEDEGRDISGDNAI